MDAINDLLEPVTKLFPDAIQDFLKGGGWLLILGLLVLIIGYLVWAKIRGRRKKSADWDEDRIDLEQCPRPQGKPGDNRLMVYHEPARVRLVVMAPAGQGINFEAAAVEKILDRLVSGLAGVLRQDQPIIKIWPGQLSHQGVYQYLSPLHHQAGTGRGGIALGPPGRENHDRQAAFSPRPGSLDGRGQHSGPQEPRSRRLAWGTARATNGELTTQRTTFRFHPLAPLYPLAPLRGASG